MLDTFWFDLRYAVRLLIRTPRESAVAIAILAVGIGANTAMFSAVKSVVLQPLPFRDPDRLIRLHDRTTSADGQEHLVNMPGRSVLAFRAHAALFDGVAAFSSDNMTMLGGDRPERVSVVLQSDGAIGTLGVLPAVGRTFTSDEEHAGIASGAALVSDGFARSHLGGLARAIGSRVVLDGRPVTIVGVMPPAYAFPYEAEFWVPWVLEAEDRTRDFAVFARLKPGATLQLARGELTAIAADVRRQYVDASPTYGIDAMTIRENLVGRQDAPLRTLAAIVTVLLLIACVNVAAILLARAVSRRREFAVRCALGASRRRHVAQLLVESLILAAAGCAPGMLLAAWIAPLTASLFPPVLSGQLGIATASLDTRVLAFAMLASVASAMVAGVLPAFGSWTASPQPALAENSRTLGIGRHGRAALGGLVVAETILTMVLLASAGLVIRHFARLQAVPLGFAAHGLLTAEVAPPPTAYPAGPRRAELIARIVDALRGRPGIVAAAATTVNPLGGWTWAVPTIAEERATSDPDAVFTVNHRLITPQLFEAMRIPLLRGRSFTDQDGEGRQPVVIVSSRLAARFWPGRDAVGRRIRVARPNAPWLTVVGVVGDVDDSHDPGVPLETWYLPLAQQSASPATEKFNLMVRTNGDALMVVPDVERAVAAVDKTLAVYGFSAMDAYRSDSLRRERTSATFMTGFGAFGLALAALGVYGVIAFTVAQRTAEIGLRIALGARAGDIIPLVLGRTAASVGVGLAAGLLAALAVNRAVASLLADVETIDPAVLAGVTALIAGVSLVAAIVPAIRAARLDPIEALK